MLENIDITSLILGLLLVLVSSLAIVMTLKVISLRQRVRVLAISLARVQDVFNHKKEEEKDSGSHQENFIKFLSDSRDWAYIYIEDVQSGLLKFVSEIEPEIAYFDEYGLVGDAYPHYHSMKKISKEYKDLKKFLPFEESNG
jgi:hypothetical protein